MCYRISVGVKKNVLFYQGSVKIKAQSKIKLENRLYVKARKCPNAPKFDKIAK